MKITYKKYNICPLTDHPVNVTFVYIKIYRE